MKLIFKEIKILYLIDSEYYKMSYIKYPAHSCTLIYYKKITKKL